MEEVRGAMGEASGVVEGVEVEGKGEYKKDWNRGMVR